MAKVKITLDTRSNSQDKDGKYPLVLRIGHKSKTRDIPLKLHLKEDQFDETTREITGIQNFVRNTKRVQKIFGDVDLWIDENKAEIKLWNIAKLKDQIEKRFFNKQSELHLFEHATQVFNRFRLKGKFSTISSYEDGLKALAKFNMRKAAKDDQVIIKTLFNHDAKKGYSVKEEYQPFDIPIKAIDRSYVKDWEAYMTNRFASKNSVNIHLRSVQSVVNDAEKTFDELKGHKPLEGVKKTSTANAPVVLTLDEVKKIRNLSATFNEESTKWHMINFFLFMFNNMGMNFMDLALALVGWYDGERFNYTRKKTEEEGDDFSIKQNEENQKIIAYYSKGKSKDDYLFPIIPQDTPQHRIFKVKQQKAKLFNKHFTEIASILEIDKNITTYTARDTWTNMGLGMGIDIHKIQKGLGHASVQTTEKHYQQSLQNKILDDINGMITNGLQ